MPEYGFSAEEVAELFSDLVVYDEAGRPLTVQYHILGTMLLNEVKNLKAQHERKLAELRAWFDRLEAALADPPTCR